VQGLALLVYKLELAHHDNNYTIAEVRKLVDAIDELIRVSSAGSVQH
jgi:hypothetical protein